MKSIRVFFHGLYGKVQAVVRSWDNERDLLYVNWFLRMAALIAASFGDADGW